MELTQDDVERILKIIDQAEHVEELDLTYGGFRLHLRRSGAPERPGGFDAPRPAAPATPPDAKSKTAIPAEGPAKSAVQHSSVIEVPEGMVAVRAPMLGTFYRAPSPGEKPFVEVGQPIKTGDTVCLIEVMKLFSSVKAETDGKVAQILVENGGLVEFNQILILIEPEN